MLTLPRENQEKFKEYLKFLARDKRLTPQQTEIFLLIFADRKNKTEVAEQLEISENACQQSLGEIYHKFELIKGGRGKQRKLNHFLLEQFSEANLDKIDTAFSSEEVIDWVRRKLRTKKLELNDVEKAIIEGTYHNEGYEDIAKNCGKSIPYLQNDVAPKLWRDLSDVCGEEVNKRNFAHFVINRIRRFQEDIPHSRSFPNQPELPLNDNKESKQEKDNNNEQTIPIYWENAPDTSVFYGRKRELDKLKECVSEDNYQLLAITGLEQIGKSFLAAKFVEENQDNFNLIVWKDCHDSDFKWNQVLLSLSQIFYPKNNSPNDEKKVKEEIINYLKQKKCLLIFDNLPEKEQNQIKETHKLIELIKEIALVRTKSHILLTTTDISPTIKSFFGKGSLGYSLSLSKYSKEEVKEILETQKVIYQQESELDWLYKKCYEGLPKQFADDMRKINNYCSKNLSNYKFTYKPDDTEKIEEIVERMSLIEAYITLYLCGKSGESANSAPFNQLTKNIYDSLQKEPSLQKEEDIKTREELWIKIDSLLNKTIIKVNENGEFELGTLFKNKLKIVRNFLKNKLKN